MSNKQLIGILREEKAVLSELLDLAKDKRTAIFEKNIDRLDAVVRREQGTALRLGHWEKQRLAILAALDNPPPSGSPTLLFLADSAAPEEAAELRSLRHDLNAMTGELSKLNNENLSLIQSKLDYVQFALDALSAGQSPGIYGSRGYETTPDSAPKTIMDRKG